MSDDDFAGWVKEKGDGPIRKPIGRRHAWTKQEKAKTNRTAIDRCKVCGLERATDMSKVQFGAREITTTYRHLPPNGDGRWTSKRPECRDVRQGELFSGARIDPSSVPATAPTTSARVENDARPSAPRAPLPNALKPYVIPEPRTTIDVVGVASNGCEVILSIDADCDWLCDEWEWTVHVLGLQRGELSPVYRLECGLRKVDRIAERVRHTAPRRKGVIVTARRTMDGYMRQWGFVGGAGDSAWSFREIGRP